MHSRPVSSGLMNSSPSRYDLINARAALLVALATAFMTASTLSAAAQAAKTASTPPPEPSRFDLYGGYGYLHPVNSEHWQRSVPAHQPRRSRQRHRLLQPLSWRSGRRQLLPQRTQRLRLHRAGRAHLPLSEKPLRSLRPRTRRRSQSRRPHLPTLHLGLGHHRWRRLRLHPSRLQQPHRHPAHSG